MRKIAAPAALALSLSATAAIASSLTFDATGTRAFDYVAIGGDQLKVCTVNCLFEITGSAFSPPDTGTFTFGPLGPVIIGPEVAGAFAFPATQSFDFTALDGDEFSGIVTWDHIADDTLTPTVFGTLHGASSSGDATFLATWSAPFDAPLEFSMSIGCSLHHLALQDGQCPTDVQESSFLYGHNDVPGVPEPSTLALLMAAVLGLAAWRYALRTVT